MIRAAAAVCCLLLFAPALPANAKSGRVAIVVGNNNGGVGKTQLRYAERDAQRVANLFETLGGVDDVHLLLGRSASELRTTLERVTSTVSADPSSVVLFFYSGHADDTSFLMGESSFAFSELRQRLQHIPARVTIAFVDACQSGRLVRAKGGRAVPVVDVRFEDNPTYKGRVFVTSSAAGEVSQEADDIQASYFTHYLVSALRGAADLSGDRQVSLEEAYQYVYRNTLVRTSGTLTGTQHPTYDVDMTGRGELILTQLRKDFARLVLSKKSRGSYLVRGASDGSLVAEVNKAPGAVVRVALPPGSFVVGRVEGERIFETPITTKSGEELVLDESHMQVRKLHLAVAKGAEKHMLGVAYVVHSGYLKQATPSQGPRLVYLYDAGLLNVGAAFEFGFTQYLRHDGIDVGLWDVACLGQLGWRVQPWRRLSVETALEAGLAFANQRGELPQGGTQRFSSTMLVYRGRLGGEIDLGGVLLGAWGWAGQTVFRGKGAFKSPITIGAMAGVNKWF